MNDRTINNAMGRVSTWNPVHDFLDWMWKKMITEDEILEYGMGCEKIFQGLEQRILDDIIRRIKKTQTITSTADYQIGLLVDMGYDSETVKKWISEALDESEEYVNELYKSVAESEYVRDKAIYEAKGVPFVPFEENTAIRNILNGALLQTGGTLNNLSQSMGFVIGGEFVALTDYYQKTMSQAIVDIASGAFDYNTVLRKTVKEMSNSGIRWIDYESGWHNRITVASRRSVMTGLSQITQGVVDYNSEKLGAEKFEVSAHGGARPSHASWQGGVYTKKELETICGLGTVTGLLGANCYHTYYPFYEGLSKRTYSDEQLKEWQRNDTHEYKGKKISQYDASQIMRQKETQMRASREKISLLKKGGADAETIKTERIRYRVQMANYKELANKFDLKPRLNRVYIDGLGRV